jgi:hypothetical protein
LAHNKKIAYACARKHIVDSTATMKANHDQTAHPRKWSAIVCGYVCHGSRPAKFCFGKPYVCPFCISAIDGLDYY